MHAILRNNNRIVRLIETAPDALPDGLTAAAVTKGQAAAITKAQAARRPIFLVAGALLTGPEWRRRQLLARLPIGQAKALLLRESRAATDKQLAAGIPVGTLTLGATAKDRAAFVELLTLMREAEALGNRLDQVTITDAAGTLHTLPATLVRQVLVDYGAAYMAIWTTRVSIETSIKAAVAAGDLVKAAERIDRLSLLPADPPPSAPAVAATGFDR